MFGVGGCRARKGCRFFVWGLIRTLGDGTVRLALSQGGRSPTLEVQTACDYIVTKQSSCPEGLGYDYQKGFYEALPNGTHGEHVDPGIDGISELAIEGRDVRFNVAKNQCILRGSSAILRNSVRPPGFVVAEVTFRAR